ncbi:MAG: hypothetical protein K8R54_15470 [Bacteroidales bacterium]|nr:hypothetical protein [Bacteroidales bacterium]
MMDIKYIYKEKGKEEAVIIPIEFWNDLLKRFDLNSLLKKENYFLAKYSNILLKLDLKDNQKEKTDDFFSLFGSWQSDKTGEEIINEIYSARNDKPREIEL